MIIVYLTHHAKTLLSFRPWLAWPKQNTQKTSQFEKVKGCGTTTSRFQDFEVSNTKPQCTTTPEFRKVKGCGTTTLGFWVSGFRDFRVSNNNPQYTTIPEFSKGERVWDQHFGISGFGVSNVKPQYTTILEFQKHKDLRFFPAQKDTKG